MEESIKVKEYDKEIQRDIGGRIQNCRLKKGITGADMAAYLDITNNSYSRIERGETKCDIGKIYMICQVLDVTADYLVFGTVNKCYITLKQMEAVQNVVQAFS
ncbi:MAG: helix-turn-helix transcriptional regulator [Lachnospiraceae bacterium]|nr:helix-turn-helix transcriptional regulator [Lachnospiraceae bacterium]MBQ4530485.1 helix-turn-helix transcriptional regulator [Lachnospiraceae bacterium]